MSNQDVKDTNPKDIVAAGKVPVHLWPATATVLGSIGLLEGMLKYGRSNWREKGVKVSVYIDAAMRHLFDYMEGDDLTSDVGVHNLANALACLAIIVDADAHGELIDDRNFTPGVQGYRAYVERFTPEVARLKELFKDRNPKHYTIADNPITAWPFGDGLGFPEVNAAIKRSSTKTATAKKAAKPRRK